MRDGFSEREIVYRAEDLILRLRDVRSSRIITDETGAITEIHVVASSDRSPKMIARDVETALKAELGLEIDYRKIGVVMMDPVAPRDEKKPFDDGGGQAPVDELVENMLAEQNPPQEQAPAEHTPHGMLDREEPVPPPFFERRSPDIPPEPVTISIQAPAPDPIDEGAEHGIELEFLEDSTRIEFKGLNLSMEESAIKAEVRLESNGLEVIGCEDECCGNRPVVETVAGAAVKALVELLDENFHLCLSEVRELEIKGRKALIAVVDMIRGRDSSSFSGCAFVGRDSGEAAVMAVLDAVNRPFGRWKSRREIHYRIR
jgi:hypothetical protein